MASSSPICRTGRPLTAFMAPGGGTMTSRIVGSGIAYCWSPARTISAVEMSMVIGRRRVNFVPTPGKVSMSICPLRSVTARLITSMPMPRPA